MPFLSDPEFLSRLADVLQMLTGSAQLQPWWASIARDANRDAYNDIVAALRGRGYTAAQVAAWDQGLDFNLSIALWYALVKGGATKDWGPDAKAYIDSLDRRGELLAAAVLNGGEPVEPVDPTTGAGPVSFGRMRNDTDRHTLRGDGVRPERVRDDCYPYPGR